jgi:hypothetical protein
VFKKEDASPTLVKMIGTRAHAIWAGPIQLSHDPIMWEGGIPGQPYQFFFFFFFFYFDEDQQLLPAPSNSK